MSNESGYVRGKRREISPPLGQQQEPGEALGCEKQRSKRNSTEQGAQPICEGQPWEASPAQTGSGSQRDRKDSSLLQLGKSPSLLKADIKTKAYI